MEFIEDISEGNAYAFMAVSGQSYIDSAKNDFYLYLKHCQIFLSAMNGIRVLMIFITAGIVANSFFFFEEWTTYVPFSYIFAYGNIVIPVIVCY